MEKAVCGGSEAENVDVETEEAGEEGRAEAPPPPPTPPPGATAGAVVVGTRAIATL